MNSYKLYYAFDNNKLSKASNMTMIRLLGHTIEHMYYSGTRRKPDVENTRTNLRFSGDHF